MKKARVPMKITPGRAVPVNFAIRVALARLLAQRAGMRPRALFVDEGFGSLDTDGRQRLVEAVKAVQDDFDLILVSPISKNYGCLRYAFRFPRRRLALL